MTHVIVEEDIHKIRRRYENATGNLNENQTIPEPNKQKIREFLAEYGVTHELSTARKLFYLQHLTTIATLLGASMIIDTTKTDLERVLSALIEKRTLGGGGRRLQGKKNENTTTSSKPTTKDSPEHSGQTCNGKPLAAWTIWGFKVTMKVFWRWLRGYEEHGDPPETRWIKIRMKRDSRILPEDLLTKDEILEILRVAQHPMHKALVVFGYDLGGRPEEWLTIRIKDITFDQYGAIVRVRGKNGSRRKRLILATPSLIQWLQVHPLRDEPEASVWICLEGASAGQPLGYDRARKLIQDLAQKAGVKIRVNLYNFRHSTITTMAGELTEAELCEVFGWVQGSRMPRIYVHMSGRDVDKKLLKIHGVIKDDQVEKRVMERRVCGRCGTENPPEGRFCTLCAAPLDARTALELDKKRQSIDEVMNTLIQDSEVQQLLKKKLLELGLTAKLNQPQ
jgi:integrase/recombinase XerD